MTVALILIITQLWKEFDTNVLTFFIVKSAGLMNSYTNFVNAMLANKMSIIIIEGYVALDKKCKNCWTRIIHGGEMTGLSSHVAPPITTTPNSM